MDPHTDSDVIKFTNPKCGTKYLLLQRLCENEDQNYPKATCSISTSGIDLEPNKISKTSRNPMSHFCNPDNAEKLDFKSLPENLNSGGSDSNSKRNSCIKNKRKRWKRRRGHCYINQFDCFPPKPGPSREKCVLKPIITSEPWKSDSKIKSKNITLVRGTVRIPSISQLSFDDSNATGMITQKVLGQQSSPINSTKRDLDNSGEERINLSISDESHTRVLLTPLEQTSYVNNTKLEPEIIVLSSDSSNKSCISEHDSNHLSPSLLENASILIDVGPSYNHCEPLDSQEPLSKFNASKAGKKGGDEVNVSKKRKRISPADLQATRETCEHNCCSLSTLESKYSEDIEKGSRKCLKLIMSVICSHFDITHLECLKCLENNQYNILTTLLELQSLSSTHL